MLSTLLAVAMLVQAKAPGQSDVLLSGRGPLLPQVFPKPDGKNGLEHYLRAIDMLPSRPNVGTVASRLSGGKAIQPLSEGEERDLLAVLAVLKKGNTRPVTLSALLPKPPINAENSMIAAGRTMRFGAGIRTIAKATACASITWFKEGRSAEATPNLLALLRFHQNIKSGSLILSLIGTTSDSIVFAAFDKHLDRLSSADLIAVLESTRRLEPIDAYRKAMREEGRQTIENALFAYREFQREMKSGTQPFEDPAYDLAVKFYKGLPPSQRQSYPDRLSKELSRMYSTLDRQFGKPEHLWTLKASSQNRPAYDPLIKAFLAGGGQELFPGTLVAFAKTRTRLRLLRLHALIRLHRKRYGRYPKSLLELREHKSAYDPLSNGSFSYKGDLSSYRLFSKGAPETGAILLGPG